ncbi:MAG: hypothetical protein II729_05725 [Ruminococcus sp.]|nr:hypothetical protein [Ruminococcus sp.]
MNRNLTIEAQYLNDIFNFKTNFCSIIAINVNNKYPAIACSYLNTIIAYLTNLAELSNQFAKLQSNSMFISSIIISRSIFEECAILNQLIKENKSDTNSSFYKSLYIQDMYQDIVINNGWNNNNEYYWRRIHNFLLKHFKSKIKKIQIQPFPKNEHSFKGYNTNEKIALKKIVEQLKEEPIYKKYTKSKLCSNLFKDVYQKTELIKKDKKKDAKNDIRIIYSQLCHYSHLSLTAIDDFNSQKEGNEKPNLCFDKKISNNEVILQWMKYSLDYILTIFTKYCNDLYTSKQSK